MSAAPRLAGLGVVITRPRAAAEALAADLAAAGARPIVFPALEIVAVDPNPVLEAALASLAQARIAIFVSANAVATGLAAVRRKAAFPPHVRVAAVGSLTAAALRDAGFAEVIAPERRFDSDALLEHPELQRVEGTPIIVFRGVGGRERLLQVLEERGARVTYAECYRRVRPQSDPGPLLQAWERGEVEAVAALSAETLEHFTALIGAGGRAMLSRAVLVVPHAAIAAHPEARRFARVLVSAPGAAGLLEALGKVRGRR